MFIICLLTNSKYNCLFPGSGVMINNAHVTKADISATNGVVHVIDHVLIPARYLFSTIIGKK